tara:strand:- start:2 stop:109 length:108 start_codon:yes stop_codon:yes gene_type:complete
MKKDFLTKATKGLIIEKLVHGFFSQAISDGTNELV